MDKENERKKWKNDNKPRIMKGKKENEQERQMNVKKMKYEE